MKHNEWCIAQQEKYKSAKADFEEMWPKYCKHCGGYGYFMYAYDPSPAGVSLSPGYMIDVDICPECEGADEPKCSLCGVSFPFGGFTEKQAEEVDGDMVGTKTCGCPINAGMPVEHECVCWYEKGQW